jgi:hypothetical protein
MGEIAKSGKWQAPDISTKRKTPLKNKRNKNPGNAANCSGVLIAARRFLSEKPVKERSP